MTTMNWEKLKTNSLPSGYAYDELPAAGSWRDQARYLTSDQTKSRSNLSRDKYKEKILAEANQRLHGITLVVNYMKTNHYKTRPIFEKNQILEALKSSLSKLLMSDLTSYFFNKKVIMEARKYCGF